MPHSAIRRSTGQRLSRCLLAVLALAGPLSVRGDESKLAPLIDRTARRDEAAARSAAEPSALVVAAEAMPLLFDPASGDRPQQRTALLHAAPEFVPEPVNRTVFLATRGDRLERTFAPRINPAAPPAGLSTAQTSAADPSVSSNVPRWSGIIQPAAQDPLSENSGFEKPHQVAPSTGVAELRRKAMPQITEATHSPIEPLILRNAAAEVAEARTERIPPEPLPATDLVAQLPLPSATARPVMPHWDADSLLAVLQPSPSASDLPAPLVQPRPDEQIAEAEDLEAFELDVSPIHELSIGITPEVGELPTNYAAARFAREGEIAHRIGFSRAKFETQMMWAAPALCYQPLYFQDVNLERHGYKVPLVQPALSAAHFFGRVPLLPYMLVSEGHRQCRYPLGHYRPGDYAPYSLYIPRLRLDASAAEVAVAAGLIFAIP